MNKLSFISGYTGVCKSHYIDKLKNDYDIVLGSPTKFILELDSNIPKDMAYPTSLDFYYSQVYAISLMDHSKSYLIERGLWDYIAYHYILSINHQHTPKNYKELNLEALHNGLVRYFPDHEIDTTILYSNCDELINIIKESQLTGRGIVFEDGSTIEYYRECQDRFIEMCEYTLSRLNIKYNIITINELPFKR